MDGKKLTTVQVKKLLNGKILRLVFWCYNWMDGMGWDGMGYTVGTGVATAQKFAQRPTAFLPQHYRHFGQQGYSKKQTSPQSRVYRRVHTDRRG